MSRICFISLSAYGYFNEDESAGGGAQRQFYLLSTNLTDAFDVHFVVGDYGQAQRERRDGVTLHSAYTPNGSTTIPKRTIQLVRLWRALRRANADIYIIRCRPQKLNMIFPLLKLLRRPLIYHVATDMFVAQQPAGISGLQRAYYNRILHKCTVIAQTKYQKEQLRTNWNVNATVIPNGYSLPSLVNRFESRDHILWVGRLDVDEKRPHLYLDLAEAVPEQHFILIGPPDKQDSYMRRIVNRASEMPNVTYLGRVAPSEVHDYYQRAIALVNTSAPQREGFPNTFLEAWRYATPVLSLDIDVGRFLNTDNEMTGFAGGDLETLVSLTREMVASSESRHQLGVRGTGAFQQRFQIESVANSYRRVLEEAILSR